MSEILDIAHEMAQDLFNVGAMEDVTMLKVEELCLKDSFMTLLHGGEKNQELKNGRGNYWVW
ncbi:MAG: hypothetical protein HGB06_08820 [Chlorobaculum sp.]|jgi:hypothetical protein|nr:hypothetical protein [Chlorobaculum sp.]